MSGDEPEVQLRVVVTEGEVSHALTKLLLDDVTDAVRAVAERHGLVLVELQGVVWASKPT